MRSRWQKEKSSFRAAGAGIWHFIRFEPHARFHFLAILSVSTIALVLKCTGVEWSLLLLSFGLVIGTEMLNTAIENLADVVQPRQDDRIRIVKDIAAGAVLFSAAVSIGIALFILLPKFAS